MITDCDLDIYLSFDNVRVGELQARYLVERLPTPGKGRIVRVYGAPTDNNAKLFRQGQDNVLKPYLDRGDIQVLHEDWATDWDPANAKKILNAALAKHGTGFDAVLASNDGTAGGAIQALKESGLAGKVLVTGQDAELVACQRIARGTQAMTIYKPIRNLATRAAELAVDMAKGRPVIARAALANGAKDVPSVLLDVVAVTKDNLRETVVADGFHPEADVFAGEKGP
jgi:D-xylose transport system substrate-binding protein